jgi:hypothetical protein
MRQKSRRRVKDWKDRNLTDQTLLLTTGLPPKHSDHEAACAVFLLFHILDFSNARTRLSPVAGIRKQSPFLCLISRTEQTSVMNARKV